MKAIVGLGNPGRAYAHTRHNVGFDVIDILAKRRNTRVLGRRSRALVGSFDHGGEEILLVKPQTFMNDSGDAVAQIARSCKLDPGEVLVIHDDMDLPLGKLRIRTRGSSGGHKGIKSIMAHLGSEEFPRIRIGIGHEGEAIDHVLSRFGRKEREIMDDTLQRAADAVETILEDGIDAAMNEYNRASDN